MIFFTCKAAIQADEDAKEQLNQQIRDCTGFTIPSKLQLQQLMLHISTPVLPSPISPAEEIIDQILAATNPHEVLQLSRGCDLATARASYKNLARVIHPDKTANTRAAEAFKLVHQALQAVTCAASTTAAETTFRHYTTRNKSNMPADHFPKYQPTYQQSRQPNYKASSSYPDDKASTNNHERTRQKQEQYHQPPSNQTQQAFPKHFQTMQGHPPLHGSVPPASSTPFADDAAESHDDIITGIQNRGNTCYISAVLQLLAAIQIRLGAATEAEHPIVHAVKRTINSMQASAGPISIDVLWQSIAIHLPNFYNLHQQDAHEFLLALLQSPLPASALEDFKWQSKVYTTIPATGYHSTTLEHNICLQLSINKSTPKLEQCIAVAFGEEQLSEADSLQCPLTEIYSTTFRATSIETLPAMLTIQIKRFSNP